MSIMDVFLISIGIVTLVFAGTSWIFIRNSGDWKDYGTIALQASLGVIILIQAYHRLG